jgi:hypothetical protein
VLQWQCNALIRYLHPPTLLIVQTQTQTHLPFLACLPALCLCVPTINYYALDFSTPQAACSSFCFVSCTLVVAQAVQPLWYQRLTTKHVGQQRLALVQRRQNALDLAVQQQHWVVAAGKARAVLLGAEAQRRTRLQSRTDTLERLGLAQTQQRRKLFKQKDALK